MSQTWVTDILARYGQTVMVRSAAGETAARAFLQPATERKELLPDKVTGIGWGDGRLWRYLGLAQVDAGDTVLWNGLCFRVRSSRAYYIGDQLNHWWAVLEQAKEAAE